MDICLVSKMFPPDVGGAETYAYELSNTLGRAGHNVDVFTMEAATDGEIDVHENVSVTRLMKRRRLVTVDTVLFSIVARRKIDFDAYDVVHGTLMPASTVAFTPGFGMADVPLVVTSHGTSVGEMRSSDPHTYEDYLMKYVFHPMNIVLDSIAGRFADRIIAISDHTQEQLVDTYRFDSDRVSMIPHGVDNERFHPDAGPHPAPDSEKFTLLYVGRLGPRKGVDLAIESFAALDRPDVELLIAGTGRHEDRLRNLASELGVSNRVRFLGFVPDDELPALYASSDLFVLLSSYEGYGLVLLESMACGTPVVASRAGGITTVVDGKSGALVSREIGDIIDSIDSFIEDNDHHLEATSAAQTRATELDWNEVADRVIDEYVHTEVGQ
ncbi:MULTISPECIES: glycosyltransferase family 4 protein [unclassified Halorubrum]|uniref:glycosyltransferase family 4 protein n=1 Tax=unclassified Halorubrum TaxID=2642239 RepID=UPI001F544594|nr:MULTISPECIES: glycosyltransferase family 4 protein [unclassified Halorubrum]